MQTRRLLLGFGALFGLLGVLYIAILEFMSIGLSGDCSDSIKQQLQSPGGQYTADLYLRDCGATTSYSTNVSLRTSTSRFDGDENTRALTLKGNCDVTMDWQNDTLSLSYPSSCEIFHQLASWRGVKIDVMHTPTPVE